LKNVEPRRIGKILQYLITFYILLNLSVNIQSFLDIRIWFNDILYYWTTVSTFWAIYYNNSVQKKKKINKNYDNRNGNKTTICIIHIMNFSETDWSIINF
jgi:hypothetical protein